MATLLFKPTTHGPGGYKDRVTIQILRQCTSDRAYVIVPGLTTPTEHWDEQKRSFVAGTESAEKDNATMRSLLDNLAAFQEKHNCCTPRELRSAFVSQTTPSCSPELTFGQWLDMVIEEETRLASTNYQRYKELRNKLKGINARTNQTFSPPSYDGIKLCNTPVKDITKLHFMALGQWIKDKMGGKGYEGLMACFQTTFQRYADSHPEVDVHTISYKWRKQKPKNRKHSRIYTLSSEDIERIENMDLSVLLKHENKRNLQLLELYRDTLMLMYYTLSRPADVIQFRWWENFDPRTNTLTYCAYKNRNKRDVQTETTINVCDKALAIINKYKGQSKGGYLLPFPFNDQEWDVCDVEQHRKWENKRKHTLDTINEYLKRIAAVLKLNVPNLTNYVFRRSSITNAASENKIPVANVARMAATSIEYINESYFGHRASTMYTPFAC